MWSSVEPWWRVQTSRPVAKLLGDEHRAAGVLLNISAVYNGQGRWDDAIRVCKAALEVFRRFKDQSGEASALNSLATQYTEVGDLAAAKQCLEASLEISRRLSDLDGAAAVLSNLGNLDARHYAWENAITHYSDALKIYAGLGSVLSNTEIFPRPGRSAGLLCHLALAGCAISRTASHLGADSARVAITARSRRSGTAEIEG
jgi:tetratricopeptide (TPR) repeat protein